MSELLAPIELTDDELAAVSGGRSRTTVVVGIAQSNRQDASLAQVGGSLSIGNGAFSGNLSFSESFSATIDQTASNYNNGSVSATVSASSS